MLIAPSYLHTVDSAHDLSANQHTTDLTLEDWYWEKNNASIYHWVVQQNRSKSLRTTHHRSFLPSSRAPTVSRKSRPKADTQTPPSWNSPAIRRQALPRTLLYRKGRRCFATPEINKTRILHTDEWTFGHAAEGRVGLGTRAYWVVLVYQSGCSGLPTRPRRKYTPINRILSRSPKQDSPTFPCGFVVNPWPTLTHLHKRLYLTANKISCFARSEFNTCMHFLCRYLTTN